MQAENIKTLAVDASFILAYLLPDEIIEQTAKELFTQFKLGNVVFVSTHLLAFEVINSLKMAVIRKRITQSTAQELVEIFLSFKIDSGDVNFNKTFSLAFEENLTVYDASYVALAVNKHIPLLTLDDKLKNMAN